MRDIVTYTGRKQNQGEKHESGKKCRILEHFKEVVNITIHRVVFLSAVPIMSADLGWSYQKAITIDHTKVNSTLIDFPVLISITGTDLKNRAQNDGDDILFVNMDNTIKLDHEIEYFNGSTGELQAWVRIPSLSSSDDTIIHMYYGNPISGNQQNATGVWDYNYTMIQHLGERPDNDTEGHYDSTSNNNIAAPKNFGDVTGSTTADVTALTPDIDVTNTASPTTGAPCTDVTFTIDVTNTGDCTLNPVRVVDTLPAGMSYVATGTSPIPDGVVGNTITWTNVSALSSGASTTITLVANIDSGASGTLNNTANATGTPPTGENVTGSDTAEV